MKNKLIKTENYLLVVDESEIKEGDYTYQESANLISKFNNAYCKKIIAHLPLNNSSILQGVDLLPPLLIKCYCGHTTYCDCAPLEQEDDVICPYPESKQNAVDWHNGYNKAKEKYKYTEEDIWKAFDMGKANKLALELNEEMILSLSQPKMPTHFEFEINNPLFALTIQPKTATDSQGQTEWVGKYIY